MVLLVSVLIGDEKIELTEKEIQARSKVCLPLDGLTEEQAHERIKELGDLVGIFKVNDLFTSMGPRAVEMIQKHGAKCFLDLKFHDIPNTVKNYAFHATNLGVYMFNVHASGGLDMMRAAVEGVESAVEEAEKYGIELPRPRIYGVTVLTSLDLARFLHNNVPIFKAGIKCVPTNEVLSQFTLGWERINFEDYYGIEKLMSQKKTTNPTEEEELKIKEWELVLSNDHMNNLINKQVLHLAELTHKSGLDGIVCSAGELDYVKPYLPDNFSYVTPGIKAPITGKVGKDQLRVFTPSEAIRRGSDILVIGRAITGYNTPEERRRAAYQVLQDIASVL